MAHKKWVASLICVMAVAWVDAAGLGTPSATAAPLQEAVEVDRVRLVLGGVKLDKAGGGTKDWVSEESRVVEVDVSGDPAIAQVLFDAPAGTYKDLKISIDKLEPGKPAEAPLLAEHLTLADASIAIDGRIVWSDGSEEPFTFTAAVDQDLEIKFKPFLVVSGTGGLPVTLVVDTARWFLDQKGWPLDPTDPADRSDIEANLKRSLRALARGGISGPITGVEVDRLRLVLGGVKLDKAGVDRTRDWVSKESRVVEAEADLGGVPAVAHIFLDVPAGTYKGIEISMDKLEPGKPAEAPLLAEHPDLAEASVAIDGRIFQSGSEESFTFTAALGPDLKIKFKPFLVVGQAGVTVTLVLGRGSWFLDKAGSHLDPRDPANRSDIEANLKKSLVTGFFVD